MLDWALKRLFGTSHERTLKKLYPKVDQINRLEADLKKLSDAELKAKTPEFKQQLANGAKVDDILVPAFAVCREASFRALKMRHYDVQLIGGMVLNSGAIAEMRTGEGKTLVATLSCYLNALEGKGVHVVTVNDYLARRDAEWMGKLYNWLGMSTGIIVSGQGDQEKKRSYAADITYGQNNEFGFDYLRDNMKFSALDYAQRPLHYAIVDEVDSILIDEARTPLIISGQAQRSSDKYRMINDVIPRLRNEEHFTLDEKGHSVTLTESGVELAEKLLLGLGVLTGGNLYEPINLESLHILNQCLRAHTLYKRDVQYMVREGKVMIIDEFTGRVLAGRRWSDGLHQAVEAKENVRIQEENRTMATITFQNMFRIYKKLSGMTGTAETEATEFHSTYKLDVIAIPTNRSTQRVDYDDVVYKTEREKFTAVVDEIRAAHTRGQPVLVGTTSVEKSSAISRILTKQDIAHNVLNAKHHENEAVVIAQAGRKGAITVSTNMAGRGTDIILGGNAEMMAKLEFKDQGRLPDAEPEAFEQRVKDLAVSSTTEGNEVRELGGLYIIGTERHESRRIDNQLRGRAGRQGDPGTSRFFLSLEDDLMRIFAGDRVKKLMEAMGMPDGEPIEHPWVTKSVENAQKKVEERNFDVRKNLLEYDDVMNAQRRTIYGLRQALLEGRYEPDIVDAEGKPTGKKRKVSVLPRLVDSTQEDVAMMLAMYLEKPPARRDGGGRSLPPEATDFKAPNRFVEWQGLQADMYRRWGVYVDFRNREDRVESIYQECMTAIPLALTEQRERVLDLMDRILCAMVEDACPATKPPEDWDWGDVYSGFREHFGAELPDSVASFTEPAHIVEELYDRCEKLFEAKEQEVGTELILRIFRHIYLEELDTAWVDHLTDIDHLRDGIGLRGYGQKDPRQEYKKEAYNLFLSMVAKVSANVVTKLFASRVKVEDEEVANEEADLAAHLAQLAAAQASHEPEPVAPPEPERLVFGEGAPCPCGSGKPFTDCHGKA
jgi:preprotein translocase subunit SecA